jgi:flagellar biosynthesis/type III secretory pathway M-ring protein FliF/YscJ
MTTIVIFILVYILGFFVGMIFTRAMILRIIKRMLEDKKDFDKRNIWKIIN